MGLIRIFRLSLFTFGIALGFAREVRPLDAGWSFHLGEAAGAQAVEFDANGWRHVDVPHDWSIELPFDRNAPGAGGGGYFQNGIGWYRRAFEAPSAWAGQSVVVEFDGVYMNSEVCFNGVSMGRHPNGYTPIRLDITRHLKIGADNVLAVRVDNAAQPNSRWYSGAGIYRHVRLVVAAPQRVAPDGIFSHTSSLSTTSATLEITTRVCNSDDRSAGVTLEHRLLDPEGQTVATSHASIAAPASSDVPCETRMEVGQPRAWTPESPTLYRLVTRVLVDNHLADEVTTPLGLRTVRVSAERGFELNGKMVKLNGGNVHHDNGIIGAIALDWADERRVRQLREAGFNAVRTSHNPPSPGFLDACDRLGLLVLEEAFDGWEKKKNAHDYGVFFADWAERDLSAMVMRDRNRPSVVLWSIGNEVFERAAASGPRIARQLAAKVRDLDPTRPITIGLNNVGPNGDWTKLDPMFAPVDVAGHNYELQRHAIDHARLPQRVIVAAESYQSEMFANWRILQEAPYVIGDFVWSALDYLGEAGLGRVFPPGEKVVKPWEGPMWPWKGAPCGEIDLTGERKPASHYRNIVWDRGEKLYAAVLVPSTGNGAWGLTAWSSPPARADWTWPGHEGRDVTVEVYSRHEAVRLYLNGRLRGEKPTAREQEFKASFTVAYAAGELTAVGVDGGRETERFGLRTAGAPARLQARVDRLAIRADGGDVAFVVIEAVDQHGVVNPLSDVSVRAVIEGPATLAGFGNADLTTSETYRDNPHRLSGGRAVVALRSTHASGKIVVRLTSPGLPATKVTLEAMK